MAYRSMRIAARSYDEQVPDDLRKAIMPIIRDIELRDSHSAGNVAMLRELGLFFKRTNTALEYDALQGIRDVVPGHVPRSFGLVLSNGTRNPEVHGYLLEYIEGAMLAAPFEGWMGGFKEKIIEQLQRVFGLLHAEGVSHNDVHVENTIIRRTDGNLFVIDPIPLELVEFGSKRASMDPNIHITIEKRKIRSITANLRKKLA